MSAKTFAKETADRLQACIFELADQGHHEFAQLFVIRFASKLLERRAYSTFGSLANEMAAYRKGLSRGFPKSLMKQLSQEPNRIEKVWSEIKTQLPESAREELDAVGNWLLK